MKKIGEKIKEVRYQNKKMLYAMMITFLCAFIVKSVFCVFALPVRTLSDEVATISGAAYLAGYDWSSVVSNAGYYGVGFTSLLSVFFLIFENPVYIYRSMLIVCALVQSMSVFLVFYVCIHYCRIKNVLAVSLIALSSSFFVVTRATIVYNEHILILISWICMILLLKLVEYSENKNKKRCYTFGLMICLAYSLTIHTRALILWIALVVTVVFWGWIKKKWLVSPGVVALTGVVGYVFSQMYIKNMQTQIWTASEGQSLRNASIPVPEVNMDLFSADKWQAWLNIVLGQLNTINIFSGGLLILFLVFFVYVLWKTFIKDKSFKLELENKDIYIFVPVIAFFSLCVAMTIFAQSFTWLPGAATSLAEGIYNTNYGTKAFTYVRYMGPYCGPLFMVGCIWLYQSVSKKHSIGIYYKTGLAVLISVSIYWVACIVPYFHQTTATNVLEVLIPFSLSTVEIEHARLSVILPATAIVIVLYSCYGFLIKKHKINAILIITCVILIYQYAYDAVYWDFPTQTNNYYKIGYDVSNYIREVENEVDLPDKIYVQDVRDITDHQIFYEIQFLLYDYRVIPLDKESYSVGEEDFILVTNESDTEKINEWVSLGCRYVNFDDYYILIGGTDLQQQFIDNQIELTEYIELN